MRSRIVAMRFAQRAERDPPGHPAIAENQREPGRHEASHSSYQNGIRPAERRAR